MNSASTSLLLHLASHLKTIKNIFKMKKIILAVILLAAVGGAVYLYSQRNREIEPSPLTSYKETIIGDWKIDSIAANDSKSMGLLLLSLDSNLTNYTFRFAEDGVITQLLNDSIVPQRSKYEWKDSSQLIILEGDSLTDKELMQVIKLTPDQLDLRSDDSAVIHFRKKK
jgi:hypothetical protein